MSPGSYQISALYLSLHFNGHFPGEPGSADVHWSKGWWKWWWQLRLWSWKAPVKSPPPTNQHPVFTGRMPFLSPDQQCQSTEGKISHAMDLLTQNSPGGLPTTSCGYLWGRFAMPIISRVMPVPQGFRTAYTIYLLIYLLTVFRS